MFQNQSGRREPCADATVLLEIMHFRQTCERTGVHIYVAFGVIRALSVPDGRRALRARRKTEMITRTRIQHLALSLWMQRATESPRQLQRNLVVSTFEAERWRGVMSRAQLRSFFSCTESDGATEFAVHSRSNA